MYTFPTYERNLVLKTDIKIFSLSGTCITNKRTCTAFNQIIQNMTDIYFEKHLSVNRVLNSHLFKNCFEIFSKWQLGSRDLSHHIGIYDCSSTQALMCWAIVLLSDTIIRLKLWQCHQYIIVSRLQNISKTN